MELGLIFKRAGLHDCLKEKRGGRGRVSITWLLVFQTCFL